MIVTKKQNNSLRVSLQKHNPFYPPSNETYATLLYMKEQKF